MIPLLLGVPLVLTAPVPKEFRQPPELHGTWVMTELEVNGNALPRIRELRWQFARGELTITDTTGSARTKPYTSDSTKKRKELDFENGAYSRGLYQVTGNVLVVCMGQDRPLGFDGGPSVIKYTFQRAKDS